MAAVVIGVVWTVAGALIQSRAFWLFAVLRLGPVLVALAALVTFALLGDAEPPPGFVVREGTGFAAPQRRGFNYLVVGEVLMLAVFTGQMIDVWPTWFVGGVGEGAFGFWVTAVTSVVVVLVFGALVARLVVTALRGGPLILLTPRALVLHDVWGIRTIPWEALRPGRPLFRVRRRTLTLTVDRPELVVRRGLSWGSTRRPWLVLQHFRVHRWFIADVIRFYVDHPQRRYAIGTSSEYQRLLPELGVPVPVTVTGAARDA